MLTVRCIRCGGPHLVWECPVSRSEIPNEKPAPFDKVAYMRAYMKKRREAARREGKRID